MKRKGALSQVHLKIQAEEKNNTYEYKSDDN